jgi:3-dehydrotetronate 4-kinase
MTSSPFLLGCIADDFTGATDLANNLVRCGLRVIQTIGVPSQALQAKADAIVIALKSRTIEPQQAVAQSLEAARWLQAAGATQIYFKYCSTFDSTPQGNIGPVTDALMDHLGADFTIACPAFPEAGRTIFNGHLFVGQALLSDSGMKNHPLTPMTDANLVRVMQAQTRRKVGLLDHTVIRQGAAAIEQQITALKSQGVGVAIADATCNQDLVELAAATRSLALVTAGSGLAIGVNTSSDAAALQQASQLPTPHGRKVILSGSCSTATNEQVQAFVDSGHPAFKINPLALAQGADLRSQALAWFSSLDASQPALVYATAQPDEVKAIQAALGTEKSAELVEQLLSQLAVDFLALGAGQYIVAGGETSGACVKALGIEQMQVGPQIAPGVPWCHALCHTPGLSKPIHITLKSGNFGQKAFFTQAFAVLA